MNQLQVSHSKDKFLVPVKLQLKATTKGALIDSGAHDCYIRRDVLSELHLEDLIQGCETFSVQTATNQRETVKQKVKLQLTIGSWCGPVSLFVLDELSQELILGLPFVRQHNQLIDWEQLTFAGASQEADDSDNISSLQVVDGVEILKSLRASDTDIGLATIVEHQEVSNNTSLEQKFLEKFKDTVTNDPPSQLPPLSRVCHEIHLIPGSNAPARPPYRLSGPEQTVLKKEIEDLLQKGFIVPSTSPYSAPVLFVKKSDGSLRLCVDYRLLNMRTIRNKFPLPVIDDLIDQLGNAKWFSKLDLMSGYHQIRINPNDEHKTGFSTRSGHYQFRVMPFGLTNAPATFQSYMNQVFQPFLFKFVVVYLDDILVYSDSKEAHMAHLEKVLCTLQEHGLVAKKSKCEFFQKSVSFLGFQLSQSGLLPMHEKVKAVQDFPVPQSPKQAMSFMGLCNFYRRFIKGFSEIAAPIIRFMTGKCEWREEQDSSFCKLKHALTTFPVLKLPDFKQSFSLTTDASDFCMGAVLEQRDKKGALLGVVSYWSKTLIDAQTRYTVQEKEFLAIVEALKHFRHLLLGQHFVIRTDHFSLQYLMTQSKVPQNRIARWLDYLAEFDFSIEHLKGTKNSVADALSRVSINAIVSTEELHDSYSNIIRPLLPNDATFGLLFRTLRDGKEGDEVPKEIRNHITKFKLEEGLLYFRATPGNDDFQWRLCVPECKERQLIISKHHDTPAAGHFGTYKTYLLTATRFYWPLMFRHIKKWVSSCDSCQRCKHGLPGTAGLLKPLDIPEARWQSVSMDFITGLPVSKGLDCILVIVDRLTKRAHFVACTKTTDAQFAAHLFFQNVVRLHGVPKSIVSDRDIRFMNSFWQSLHKILGTKLQVSTVNHPQTDGQTERVNSIVNQLLRTFCSSEHEKWTLYLGLAEFAYNNTYQTSIQTTPFEADLGYSPRVPAFENFSLTERRSLVAETLGTKMKAILLRTQEYMVEAQRSQEYYANQGRRTLNVKIGDFVLLHRNAFTKSEAYVKMQPVYLGPYKVVKKINENAFELDLPFHTKKHRVHNVSNFKPYIRRADHYPSDPPRSEERARFFVNDIVGIAGYDPEHKTWDLQFRDCDPTHCLTVSDEFLQTKVPKARRESLIRNLEPISNRDDSILEGG